MLPDKLRAILTSRKFWALVSALAAVWFGFAQHQMDYYQSVLATIGAVSAYMLSVGIEDGGKTSGGNGP